MVIEAEPELKLGCVLTACDLNPHYMDFVPVWLKAWRRTHPGVEARVILLADEVPPELQAYSGHLILYPPIEGINVKLLAQCIRLLYPAVLDCDGAVLITDVDTLPLNGTYYARCLEGQPDGRFVCLQVLNAANLGRRLPPPRRHRHVRLPIMYNAALPAIWGEVFSVANLGDVELRMREIASSPLNAVGALKHKLYHGVAGLSPVEFIHYLRFLWRYGGAPRKQLGVKAGMLWDRLKNGPSSYRRRFSGYVWYYDEMYLYKKATAWHRRTGDLALLPLGDNGWRPMLSWRDRRGRLELTPELKRDVRAGLYTEWHCPRPYSEYREQIEAMVELL